MWVMDNSVYMVSARTGQVLDMVVAHTDGTSAICVLQRRFLNKFVGLEYYALGLYAKLHQCHSDLNLSGL